MSSMPPPPQTARILYVMAVANEYGPHLRSRIDPLMTGVGPVEAAVVLSAELARLEIEGRLPHLLVSLGSAGSRVLEQCEVFQAATVSYRDMDATALGFAPGETPFLGLPAELDVGPMVPGIQGVRLSTGANIVSGRSYDGIEAEMVDMETYAVLRACQRFHVPMIAIRGISDGIEELRGLVSWTQYLGIIDEKLAHAVDVIEAEVMAGRLP